LHLGGGGGIMRRSAVLILLLFAGPLAGQPRQPVPPITGNGTEAFRAVVASYGLKPLADLKDVKEAPTRTLIISFRGAERKDQPYPDLLDNLLTNRIFNEGLVEFLDRGGAVLVATDQSTRGLEWAKDLEVRVDGIKVSASLAEHAPKYHAKPDCPYVQKQKNIDAEADLFHGIHSNRVATNKPSFLWKTTSFQDLAVFSGTCHGAYGEVLQQPVRFAQGGRLKNGGRFLLLADHSVFINSMLVPIDPDNSNLEFTRNCLNWLTYSPDGKRRDRVLFIDDGQFQTDFNVMLRELPPPSPEEILDLLWQNRDQASPIIANLERSGWFSELERENLFNRMLLSAFPHWTIVRFFLLLGVVALFAYGLRRLVTGRHRFAKNVPRFSVALERFRPRAGILETRLRGALRVGQYYEAARIKARDMFESVNARPAEEGMPPRAVIDAGWWRRGRIERELHETWQIAFGSEPLPVPARDWERWQTRLNNLRDMIRDGTIHLE
jgi:hypothetical protein